MFVSDVAGWPLEDHSTTSDVDGAFEVRVPTSLDVLLRVTHPRHATSFVRAGASPGASIDVVLERAGRVRVMLLATGDAGTEFQGATAHIVETTWTWEPREADLWPVVAEKGHVVLEDLTPGRVALTVITDAGRYQREFDIAAGATHDWVLGE